MSRGFVKEGDQEDIPVLTPRAHLPEGVDNYVTQVGMDLLLEERRSLNDEKDSLSILDDDERRIAVNHINAKLQQLNERIATAKVVNLEDQSPDKVWFGAKVTLQVEGETGRQVYQIVGVDEADADVGKISFIAPIARSLLGKEVGDTAVLKHLNGLKRFEILDITY